MTLSGRYTLCCWKDVFFGAHHKNFNEDRPILSGAKCRPMILVSGGIRFVWIFAEVPRGGGVKQQWSCRERQISAFSLAIFSDTLEMRPALLYGDMQSVVGFLVIPKCVTLIDLDCLFHVKFCFCTSYGGWHCATLENNCVKTNKDRHIHILSAVKIFGRNSSFRQYKVYADIRSGSVERRC